MAVDVDTQVIFRVMRCAYRHGVLDAFMHVQGKALEMAMLRTGADMGDLLNRLDETRPETVGKVDRLLRRTSPLFKFLESEQIMRLVGRVLSSGRVQDFLARRMAEAISRAFTGETVPTLKERLVGITGKLKLTG